MEEMNWKFMNILILAFNQTRMIASFNQNICLLLILKRLVGNVPNRKQSLIQQAKYIAASEATNVMVWIKKFINGFWVIPSIVNYISLYCD